jgi:hypothetical protein
MDFVIPGTKTALEAGDARRPEERPPVGNGARILQCRRDRAQVASPFNSDGHRLVTAADGSQEYGVGSGCRKDQQNR